MLVIIVTLFSAVSFIYYGIICLFSQRMVPEFERYGLTPAQRQLTGILQLLGSVGLLFAWFQPTFGLIAASGLAVLMLLGFLTRLKIRDGFVQSFPSFFFMLLNAFLALAYAGVLEPYVGIE
ncbi:MAG: DoxX family protein [Bacteroidota bacterium]